MPEKSKTHWEAHPETTERDNFATSIYSPGYDGILVARCNQNGNYPEHVAMILRATEAKADGAKIIESSLERVEELKTALKRVVEDVLDYERVNNLAPNPGRKYCWDSVAHAVEVLER